jgi:hypothetical protein
MRTLSSALALVLALAGCAGQLPTVQLEGDPRDLAQLVGDWSGQYVSDVANDPGGSIMFSLESAGDRAGGGVVMKRQGTDRAYERYDPERAAIWSLGADQSLTILIVRAGNGSLSGELDPYWDFDCNCQARTWFRGVIRGNVIAGTYETRLQGQPKHRTGRWRVSRILVP